MKTTLITALVIFVLLGIGTALGEQSASTASLPAHRLSSKQVKHLMQAARTAQDYRELAQYFRQEAQRMREKEQYHMEMAALYRVHPLPYDGKQTVHMQDHCMYFADKARDAAITDDEMASVQERIADRIQSGQPYSMALMSASSSAAPAAHQELTGVISDDMCRQNHMMPGHRDADCARACVKAGVKYALVTEDKVYVLKGDPRQIEGLAGNTVSVTGDVRKASMSVQAISAPKQSKQRDRPSPGSYPR
jgi:hypothetical protein